MSFGLANEFSGTKESAASTAEGGDGFMLRLRAALERLLAGTGAETGELFVADPASGDMMALFSVGACRELFREVRHFRKGEGFPGLVAESGRPVVTRDLSAEARFIRSKVKENGYRYYASYPVRSPEGVIACLGVASRKAVFSERMTPALADAAETISRLVETERLRKCLSIPPVLFDPCKDIQANLDDLAASLLHYLVAAGMADGGAVFMRIRRGDAVVSAESSWRFERPCRLAEGQAACGCGVAAGQRCAALLIQGDHPSAACGRLPDEYRTLLCLPLRDGGRLYGLITLGYRSGDARAIQVLLFLPAVGRQAARLLRNLEAAYEVEHRGAARANERVRADFGTLAERALGPVRHRADALAALADISPDSMAAELHSFSRILSEGLLALETRLVGGTPGGATLPERGGRAGAGGGQNPAGFLDIRCFGRLTVLRDGEVVPLSRFQRRHAVQMLKVLLTHYGRTVSKDRLIGLLWPEAEAERGAALLKVTLHHLRRALEPDAPAGRCSRYIVAAGNGYVFNPDSAHRLDVREFREKIQLGEKLLENGDRSGGIALLRTAADLYVGDYLEEEVYSDWAASLRDDLRERFVRLVRRLAGLLFEDGDAAGAVAYCRRALELDPAREELHRDLMRMLWRMGRRDDALRQYRLCRQALRAELGARPLPETEALYMEISGGGLLSAVVR